MNKDICIQKICSIPLDFKTKNKSVNTLISESYYFIFHTHISLLDIKNHLLSHRGLINEWETWSSNKRSNEGFYLSLCDNKYMVGWINASGQIGYEKSFDSEVDACAEYISKELVEIMISSNIERNHEKDIDILINTFIEIGNSVEGKQIPQGFQYAYYAEGLGQKIINHAITIRYLFNGHQLVSGGFMFEPRVDYSSIIILTRAAIETYLTLNYVFVAEGNEDLRQFRFLCWDLAGYIERSKMQATTEEHVILKESEKKAIESISAEIKENLVFKTLPLYDQKQALKGEWRLNYKWHDLATKAGFNIDFFRQQYKFLCSYAHASRLSVIQIQQNKTFENQKEMATSSISTIMVVLAKHIHDYIEIMPQLKDAKKDVPNYPIIQFWKTIGEELLKPDTTSKK